MRRGKEGEPANHGWAQQSSAAKAGGIAPVTGVTLRAGTSCKDEREITLCTMQRGWRSRSGSGFSPFLKITARVEHTPSPLHRDLGPARPCASPPLAESCEHPLCQRLGQRAHPARMLPKQHPGRAQPWQGGTNLSSAFPLPEMSEGCGGWEVTAPQDAQHWDVARRRWPEQLQSTGCSVWLGCPQDAFISRESSLARLVQEFVFFPLLPRAGKLH